MPELTLYNGDCIEVMKEIPDKSIDLIVCDLPYGCLSGGYRASGIHPQSTNPNQNPNKIEFKTQGCSWDIKIDLKAFWEQVRRIRKNDHTPTIHFCTTKFGYELIQSNEAEFRYDLVWDKQRGVSFLSANKMPMRSHEMIYVFSKAGAFYERKDIEGDFPAWVGSHSSSAVYKLKKPDTPGYKKGIGKGKRCVLSVISNIKTTKANAHPTEKSCDLYKWLIERYCPRGGTVLDPTFGSGNSVFTAYQLGRNAIGIEKDEDFFKKSACRLDAL
jgi:site-specific DNA-methyltransferase (adenine-specific)